MHTDLLGEKIYNMAIDCGFDNCGIIPIDDMDGFAGRMRQREEAVPESAFFYQAVGDLAGIKKRFPWAKSVIICTYWLGRYRYPNELQGKYAKSFFLSPSNPVCKDMELGCKHFEEWFQHEHIRCEGGQQFGHISIGPLRYAAVMAGLGIIRKNNFFYTEKGSFIELVGYVIDQDCTWRHSSQLRPCADTCQLCQKSCPSGALKGPFTMNPLECVSYITTFGKGVVPSTMDDSACGTWICGCDSCQDACPYNRMHDWNTGDSYLGLDEIIPELAPEKMVNQSKEYIQNTVLPYTSHHITADNYKTLQINAARSLKNSTSGNNS